MKRAFMSGIGSCATLSRADLKFEDTHIPKLGSRMFRFQQFLQTCEFLTLVGSLRDGNPMMHLRSCANGKPMTDSETSSSPRSKGNCEKNRREDPCCRVGTTSVDISHFHHVWGCFRNTMANLKHLQNYR